jgi:formylglycine-generating enzyme required for sulfatase activity
VSRREYYTDYPRTILWLIPGGEVTVGGAEDDAQPAFTVRVEPFYLGKFPITNEQFEAFDPGFERSPGSPGDHDPATGVSWRDAAEYCAWYAEVSRKPMRLPSEVDWEHACRGGTVEGAGGRWFWGDDAAAGEDFAWDAESAAGMDTVPKLDDKKANGFGLFGMLGGVWEWTGSLYRPYPLDGDDEPARESAGTFSGTTSGTLSEEGERRVLRGGSYLTPRAEATSSRRRAAAPAERFADAGFRIARPLRV